MSKVYYCLKCRRELIAARCSKCGGMNEELPYSYETWVNYMSESEREAAIKTLTRGLRYAQLISMGDELLKSKSLLDVSLISYIIKQAPEEERNMGMLMDMLEACETREDDEEFKNAIDLLFDELEKEDPECYAVKEYKSFKLSAGKTTKSILISAAARLSPFNIPRIREMVAFDEIELDTYGEVNTILYIIISDMNNTFNFLTSIMYSQLFSLLCDRAELYDGKLPIPVVFMLDEFANIGQIPDFAETGNNTKQKYVGECYFTVEIAIKAFV